MKRSGALSFLGDPVTDEGTGPQARECEGDSTSGQHLVIGDRNPSATTLCTDGGGETADAERTTAATGGPARVGAPGS